MGTVASAHHMDGLNGLAAGIVGIALGLAVATLGTAYRTGVRIPRMARLLTAMSQAMDADQAVSGTFRAGLRDLAPGVPGRRWRHGRVKITPQSVAWAPLVGRTRDLTAALRGSGVAILRVWGVRIRLLCAAAECDRGLPLVT